MAEKTASERAEENLANRIANIKASSDRARWPFSLYALLGFVVASTIYSERASWTKHWIDSIDRFRLAAVSSDERYLCPCQSARIKRYHPALFHEHPIALSKVRIPVQPILQRATTACSIRVCVILSQFLRGRLPAGTPCTPAHHWFQLFQPGPDSHLREWKSVLESHLCSRRCAPRILTDTAAPRTSWCM